MTSSLFYLMLFHLLWTFLLYGALTVVRAPAVWGIGKNSSLRGLFNRTEPKISANLSNQFEWPVFFHIGCVLAIMSGVDDRALIFGSAMVFIAGRILHSAVQIFSPSIRARGVVFTINFVAVIGIWLGLL